MKHRRHWQPGPSSPAYLCRQCGRGFRELPQLRAHEQRMHGRRKQERSKP